MINSAKFYDTGKIVLEAASSTLVTNLFYSFLFKLDNGAMATAMSYKTLDNLGYDTSYIKKNGVLLTGSDRPSTADGKKVDGAFELTLKNLILGNYLGLNVLILTSLTFEFYSLVKLILLIKLQYLHI